MPVTLSAGVGGWGGGAINRFAIGWLRGVHLVAQPGQAAACKAGALPGRGQMLAPQYHRRGTRGSERPKGSKQQMLRLNPDLGAPSSTLACLPLPSTAGLGNGQLSSEPGGAGR